MTKTMARVLRAAPLAAAVLALGGLAAPAEGRSEDCAAAAPQCGDTVSLNCLRVAGAGALGLNEQACPSQLQSYKTCLKEMVERCGSGAAAPSLQSRSCAAADAQQIFGALQGAQHPDDLETFAEFCAGTPQAALATLRAERLRAASGAGWAANADAVYSALESRAEQSTAGLRVRLLPSDRLSVGDQTQIEVVSDRAGHLSIVDVDAAGAVTQIFPNAYVTNTLIPSGERVLIPGETYGFAGFEVVPPRGAGRVIAFLAPPGSKASLSPLFSKTRGLRVLPNAVDTLGDLTTRLDQADGRSGGTRSAVGIAPYTIE